jgi:hypothetical protein
MRAAHHCETLEQLIDAASKLREKCEPDPPIQDTEIMTIAAQAWGYTLENKNRFGGHQHGAWIPFEIFASMQGDADAMHLLMFLKMHQGPFATFMITNSLHKKFGWTEARFVRARNVLIEQGYVYQTRAPVGFRGKGGRAALYRWSD